MASDTVGAGRGVLRPALVGLGLVLAAGLAYAALGGGGAPSQPRGPLAVPNPDAPLPTESRIGGVRHVIAADAPERLLLDRRFPEVPVRLLWLQGRATSPGGDERAIALDGAGGAVRFDRRLQPDRLPLPLDGHLPISVSAASDGGYWVVGADGRALRIGPDGRALTEVGTVFDYPAVSADPAGGAWFVRSTAFFAYRLATPNDPLLIFVDSAGRASRRVGSIRLPEHVLLAELANAGHVAVSSDAVFYAPFIRDEVVALSRAGDTLWVAHRGLPQSTAEPRFEIGADGPMIDYAPVNLGLALGPDGRLYVLSVPGFTTAESRVDVYDPATGSLLRSARLDTPLPTLAVDRAGRVYLLDPFRLLTGVAPAERDTFRPFELDLLSGGRMGADSLSGQVVLINFWASWCGPCRLEMPALDSLRRAIADPDFRFITMNEDVDVGDARAFIEEFGFDFPVLLGRGRLKAQYHYLGLPFTVLLDRQGRVVQRWIGYAGNEQLAAIRAVVLAELERDGSAPHDHAAHGGGH